MAEQWRVVHDRVLRRAEPEPWAKLLGWELEGKVVTGEPVLGNDGEQWLCSFFRGPAGGLVKSYMMIDGKSMNLGFLLEKVDTGEAPQEVVQLTEVQQALLKAATSLCEGLRRSEATAEPRGGPLAKLDLCLEALESSLHSTMDIDTKGLHNKLDEALKGARDLVKVCKDASDAQGQARALDMVAKAHLAKKQADTALKLAKEALAICKNLKDQEGQADALITMANCHLARASRVMGGPRAATMTDIKPEKLEDFRTQQYDQVQAAMEYAHQALGLRQAARVSVAKQVSATMKVASCYLAQGDADKAKESCEEAALQARTAKMEALAKECLEMLLDCAVVHLSRGEHNDASDCASEAAAIYKWKGDRMKAAEALRVQVEAHLQAGEGQWAIRICKEELVPLWREAHDKTQEAEALHELAKVHHSLSMPSQVEHDAREALGLLKGTKNHRQQLDIYKTIMTAYLVEGEHQNLSKAVGIASEALEVAEDGGRDLEATALLWAAECYAEKFFAHYAPTVDKWKQKDFMGSREDKELHLDQFHKAMQMCQEAQKIFRALDKLSELANAEAVTTVLINKANTLSVPTKTHHFFKNGRYTHSVHQWDYGGDDGAEAD